MCGIKSKRGLLLSAVVLLLSSPLYSEDVYEITESELTELEQILTEQEATIAEQATSLTELQQTIARQATSLETLSATIATQRDTLTMLSGTIDGQATTIDALRTSYAASVNAGRRAVFRVGAISFVVGIPTGAVLWAILR
jgi:septal ring factor EnvC (AmiA/AmiB activator)